MTPLNISLTAKQLCIPKYQPIVYLPTKCCQRLIAIGDIHGCPDELISLWSLVQPTIKDCVVHLGDLIDRGPHSDAIVHHVRFWQQRIPYLYSVLGNHDEKHCRAAYHNELVRHNPDYKSPMRTGEFFTKTHESLSIEDFIGLANNPAAVFLNNEDPSKSRILTHAGLLPKYWLSQPTKGLIRNRYVDPKTGSPVGYLRLPGNPWGQPPGSVTWQSLWKNPQRVITGHVVTDTPIEVNNCYSIDTGCVFGGKLTAYIENLETGAVEFASVDALQTYCPKNQENETAQETIDNNT